MQMWIWPLIVAIIIIIVISTVTTMKVAKTQEQQGVFDSEIAEPIRDHPFLFNPIILAIVVAGIFMGIMIAYYAATSY